MKNTLFVVPRHTGGSREISGANSGRSSTDRSHRLLDRDTLCLACDTPTEVTAFRLHRPDPHSCRPGICQNNPRIRQDFPGAPIITGMDDPNFLARGSDVRSLPLTVLAGQFL